MITSRGPHSGSLHSWTVSVWPNCSITAAFTVSLSPGFLLPGPALRAIQVRAMLVFMIPRSTALTQIWCACLLLALGCRRAGPSQGDEESSLPSDSTPESQTAATGGSTRVEIVGVDLRLFESARIHVTRLAGTASSLRPESL